MWFWVEKVFECVVFSRSCRHVCQKRKVPVGAASRVTSPRLMAELIVGTGDVCDRKHNLSVNAEPEC
jgi:hypothetical protein